MPNNKGGRPKSENPMVKCSFTLKEKHKALIAEEAKVRGEKHSQIVRRALDSFFVLHPSMK